MTVATRNRLAVKAIHNDAVAVIAWEPDGKIKDCLGYALTMVDQGTGERTVLRTSLPFKGEVVDLNTWKGKPSTELPIQKTNWVYTFKGEQGTTVVFEVVPMVGTPGNLKPFDEMKGISAPVTFTTRVDDQFDCAFTRGILSTQWLARYLPTDADGLPDWQTLLNALLTPGHELRKWLGGNVPAMWRALLDEARDTDGKVLYALYELADPELVDMLLADENRPHFSLNLGNTGKDDLTNADARRRLHAAGADIQDRMIGAWGIAHNKFQVLLDKDGNPVKVFSTSANATATGLHCQSNIAVMMRSKRIARLFHEYWNALKAEGNDQTDAFRAENAKGTKKVSFANGTVVEVWFSPNMQDKTKPQNDPPVPPDMARVFELMNGAKQGIYGEVFYPGKPSVIHEAADIWNARPDLDMFMSVSKADALKGVKAKRRKGRPPMFVVAAGREYDFSVFVKELLKLPDAHAVLHGKILVIDPFGENPVVIFGSHNLGFKASYGNDENLIIVHGNKELAQYVFANMYDLYSHFLSRQASNRNRRGSNQQKFGELDITDAWQDRFLVGYRAKQMKMLATGVWDGSGLEDPDWLKPDWVVPFQPRPRVAGVVADGGSGTDTTAPVPSTLPAGADVTPQGVTPVIAPAAVPDTAGDEDFGHIVVPDDFWLTVTDDDGTANPVTGFTHNG
ncbi:MAG: hypothetical protein K2W95_35150 [Candidatus Obscuribacterales bacterium]|nr:hypothetical protein [Candidatus Obscuribacterales bacterium]